MTFKRKAAPIVGLTAAALVLTACASSDRDGDSSDSDTGSGDGGTQSAVFTFGGAGAPTTLDPFYAADGETFRVTRQMTENLIGIKPGTADLQPELAESWEPDESGLNWTFKLREGVKFHDGTDFNAEAACANFERMFDQNEVGEGAAQYWSTAFGAFKSDAENSLYQGCEVTGEYELVFSIKQVTSRFPSVLSLTSLAIQSPKALEEGDANGISRAGEALEYPPNASNPVGTGPYKFSSYDEATRTATLERFDDYWGEPAKTQQVVIRAIPDESTRRQELQAGGIDGYDLPNPVDWQGLTDAGMNVEVRPPFNIFYVGLNPTNNDKLTDLRVRQALYYALNREQIVQSQLPEGASVATQFIPETVDGYNPDLEPFPYDPEKAKELLAEADAADLTIKFGLPTEVTRPYMPDPSALFDAMKANWEAVGITVETVADPWTGYTDKAYTEYDAFFLGWTGDYNAVDNFLSNFFGNLEHNRFATNLQDFGPDLSAALVEADAILDENERIEAYKELNRQIMEDWLPGLPISHSPPAIVVGGNVEGVVPSPLTQENFDTVTVGGA